MKCKNCKSYLFIDTWNGWVWTCYNCGHIDRKATDEEILKFEHEMKKGIKK